MHARLPYEPVAIHLPNREAIIAALDLQAALRKHTGHDAAFELMHSWDEDDDLLGVEPSEYLRIKSDIARMTGADLEAATEELDDFLDRDHWEVWIDPRHLKGHRE